MYLLQDFKEWKRPGWKRPSGGQTVGGKIRGENPGYKRPGKKIPGGKKLVRKDWEGESTGHATQTTYTGACPYVEVYSFIVSLKKDLHLTLVIHTVICPFKVIYPLPSIHAHPLGISQLQRRCISRLFDSVQLPRIGPASITFSFHFRNVHSFSQLLSTHTPHMSKPIQTLPMHSITHLFFSHKISFSLPRSIVVTPHKYRKRFCYGQVVRASVSYGLVTWFEYGQDQCDQSLNIWYRLNPLSRRSTLKPMKQQRNTSEKKGMKFGGNYRC